MFDNLLRGIESLSRGTTVPVTIKLDDNGNIDRICPSDECRTLFKIMFEDWRDIVSDEVVYCPLCRYEASSTEWNTREQSEYLKDVAFSHIQKEVGRALQKDAREFNSRQNRKSFIQMSMSYKPSHLTIPMPAEATAILTQEFHCPECSCRYSTIGAAFFCPSCGYNSTLDTFANAIETVKKTTNALPVLRQSLFESHDENVAEDSVRHICENGLVKLISCFQRYSEDSFHQLANSRQFNVRQNLFQSLSDGDSIWRRATSTGYREIVSEEEYRALTIFFQQRHLLAHRDGIVDPHYISRANDRRLSVGQRLTVSETNVTNLATIVEKLAGGLSVLVSS